jgi:hypothetical protein
MIRSFYSKTVPSQRLSLSLLEVVAELSVMRPEDVSMMPYVSSETWSRIVMS